MSGVPPSLILAVRGRKNEQLVRGTIGSASTFKHVLIQTHDLRGHPFLAVGHVMHGGLQQEWSISIQNDLFALLDRTWFQGSTEIKERVQRKLRVSVFIVGCGTWQSLWAVRGGASRAIGFQQSTGAAMADQIRAAKVIPTELLNRFHHEILLLEPMAAADFADISRAEGLEAQAAELGIALDYGEAEASGLGMRWLEAVVLKIHVTRARCQTAAAGSIQSSPNLTNDHLTSL